MIEELTASVEMSGETFSPQRAEEKTALTFVRKEEPGNIAQSGKYKGQSLPLGFASLEAPQNILEHERILWLANTMKDNIQRLQECGMEDGYFYIGYFYSAQCNCTLSPEELKALADTGIDFWFSCYDITDDTRE